MSIEAGTHLGRFSAQLFLKSFIVVVPHYGEAGHS